MQSWPSWLSRLRRLDGIERFDVGRLLARHVVRQRSGEVTACCESRTLSYV
jgi:hypothetical protein